MDSLCPNRLRQLATKSELHHNRICLQIQIGRQSLPVPPKVTQIRPIAGKSLALQGDGRRAQTWKFGNLCRIHPSLASSYRE
jgi:hypothetical protein